MGGLVRVAAVIAAIVATHFMPAAAEGGGAGGGVGRLVRALAEAERMRSAEPAFVTNYPLARLALKKVQLLLAGAVGLGMTGDVDEVVAQGLEAIARVKAGRAYRAVPGRLTELAYEAENDGSVQPYYLYLPPDFDPSRRWPLIVFLHGYVPDITVLDPWVLPDEVCQIAGKNGCILLIPYGRRNTDFQGVGEVDVLKTIELVKRDYPVDDERIYLSGVSMGGMGAWNMALRHPGMFAAITPIAGHTDMLKWWGWPAEQVPGFKKWLIEWDNPVDLVMNARGQHFFVQHGEEDPLIPADQSRTMVRLAKTLGIDIPYYEHKGQGHFIYWGTECYERAWAWQKKFSVGSPPRRIDFKTYSLEYDRAWWVRLDRIEQWGQPAEVHVEVAAGGGGVKVRTQNVAALSLHAAEVGLSRKTRYEVNGREMAAVPGGDGWLHFELTPLRADSKFPPLKRKGLCGPVEEVFDGPFIVVQGTAGDQASDTALAAKVRRWADEWNQFADGYPRLATDVEVNAEHVARFNLVLFGTPETNTVLARIADRLPIRIGDHAYTVGGKRFAGPDLGLVMCYPNPLAPDRYVLVYSGEYYGDRLAINHKHDLLPDFLIFRAGAYEYDGTNEWVCAGFFDSRWELSPASTWVNAGAG